MFYKPQYLIIHDLNLVKLGAGSNKTSNCALVKFGDSFVGQTEWHKIMTAGAKGW
jgi:hypothetical protein